MGGSCFLRESQGCGMRPFVSYAFYGTFVKYGGVDSQGKHWSGKGGGLITRSSSANREKGAYPGISLTGKSKQKRRSLSRQPVNVSPKIRLRVFSLQIE